MSKSEKSQGFISHLVSRRNYVALTALLIIVLFVLGAIFAPFLYDWQTVSRVTLMDGLLSPSFTHPLGTDQLGRDLLARVVWGARTTLLVALFSVTISMVLGVLIGGLCGYCENRITSLVMRVIDSLIAFPRALLAIIIVTIIGPGVVSLTLAIGISTIPPNARLFRGSVLALKQRQFTMAARALGAKDHNILFSHILPNTTSLCIIQGTLSLAEAILIGSGLSFLGLGPQPPTPEWGAMISSARSQFTLNPHVIFAPGFALFLVIFSFNLMGDALRDFIDPRSRKAL